MLRRVILKYLFWILTVIQRMLARRKSRLILCLLATFVGAFLAIFIGSMILNIFLTKPMQEFSYPLDIDLYNLVGLLEKQDPKVVEYQVINPLPFQYIISQKHFCELERVDLLMLVKSTHDNLQNRDAIRKTWARKDCDSRLKVRALFMLGRHKNKPEEDLKLQTENLKYKDILQMDFIDNYFNNTYKLMMGLHYGSNFCSTAKFIMFVDDDYFVNPWRLTDLVRSVHPLQYPIYLAGYVYYSPAPKRSWNNKWYISLSEYAFKTFPDYPAAGTVVLSLPMAKTLHYCMKYVKFSRFDDVFLGLILFKLHIAPTHVKQIYAYRPNVISHDVISSHGFRDHTDLLSTWSSTGLKSKCDKRS